MRLLLVLFATKILGDGERFFFFPTQMKSFILPNMFDQDILKALTENNVHSGR